MKMEFPKELFYSKSHEWVEKIGEQGARIGLTDYAQDALGDLVFVNLPEVGDAITEGEAFGDVESVKAVSDMFSPVSGTVSAVNEELLDAPQKINESPYEAWFIQVEDITEFGELLGAEDYAAFCESQQQE